MLFNLAASSLVNSKALHVEIKFEASVASTKTPKGERVDTLGNTCLRFCILKFNRALFCVGINFKIRTPNQLQQVAKILLCNKNLQFPKRNSMKICINFEIFEMILLHSKTCGRHGGLKNHGNVEQNKTNERFKTWYEKYNVILSCLSPMYLLGRNRKMGKNLHH